MTELTLADVIEGTTQNVMHAPQLISQVVIDSRLAEPGALFIALPGENSDGHLYVGQAFERGAIAALVHQPVEIDGSFITVKAGDGANTTLQDRQLPICIEVDDTLTSLQKLASFWRNKFDLRVIGITGSVGKSTTKELVAAVLATQFHVLKNYGNLNNEIGLPLTLLNLTGNHDRVVLEMGMYDVGEIALLCEMARPQVGVVTNVGPIHLERLGTIERITEAKTELVQALPSNSEGGLAILNDDDPRVQAMADKTEARVLTYGLSPEADLWASDVTSMGLDGIRFVLNYGNEQIHIRIPLLGRHSVHAALRAAFVGIVEGLDWEQIVTGLQQLPSDAQLRLVSVPGPNGSILLDDTYNASPTSTLAALNLLDDLTGAKKIAVLGDMKELGSYEEEGHRKVGCRTADIVDLLIVIGDSVRYIAEEAIACGLDPSLILRLQNNEAAIAHLQVNLGPDDVVLVKGSNSQRMGEIVSALMVSKRDDV